MLCLAFSAFTLFNWDAFRHATFFGRWPLFDWHDMHVYFLSSGWAMGEGTLYRQVPSEYPLLPNLLFAGVRLMTNAVPMVPAGYDRFAWGWVGMMLPLYCFVLHRLVTRYPRPAMLLWLTPAALHFSLYRYDVLAVIGTLFTVEAILADRLRRAALLLGLVTALKGYPLFLLPVFAVYVWRRHSFREAMTVCAINLAPFTLANLVTLGFSGVEGLLFAYRFHAERWLNGESTFDAIAYLTGPAIRDALAGVPRLPILLQAACALIAAGFRPRTPPELMRAFLFVTTAFVSFSVFYSPQFVLWLVPFVAHWTWPLASWLVVGTSWVTYAYFPVAFFRRARQPRIFEMSVMVVAGLRLGLMLLTGIGRPPATASATRPGVAAEPAA
ncbi:MAG: hypothetical protein ABIS67_04675 [Candidatus Eisenbacteria bacterium]